MKIKINGEEKIFEKDLSALDLLHNYKLDPSCTVVEVNSLILKKSELSNYIIKDNDIVELIRFMGGG